MFVIATSSTWLFSVVGGAVVLMAKARDLKLGTHPCRQCGQRGEHLVGCPGRRGY